MNLNGEAIDKFLNEHNEEEEIIEENKKENKNNIDELKKQSELLDKDIEINEEDYKDEDNKYKDFLTKYYYIPSSNVFRAVDYISNVTSFNYNPYDSPNISMQHDLPNIILTINKFNKLFNKDIITNKENIDKNIVDFIVEHNDIPSYKIEYTLIKSFLNKLIIALTTSTEKAMIVNKICTVENVYKSVIKHDVELLNKIKNCKMSESWSKFINCLSGITDNKIYIHKTTNELNNLMNITDKVDFTIEELIGNMLKTYIPSISINYFYAIKSVYIIARLINIYIHMYANNISMIDIYTISSIGIILYETKQFIFKQIPRVLPTYSKSMEKETELYIINHLFTGPQYYLLKMFEQASPIIAKMNK